MPERGWSRTVGCLAIGMAGGVLPLAGHAQHPIRHATLHGEFGGAADSRLDLTPLGGATVGPDGLLYLAQPQDNMVRVIGPDGTLVRSIGRRGSGPGEFMAVSALGWLGDTLWVRDLRLRRFTLFRPDGSTVRTVPFPRVPHPRVEIRAAALLPEGRILLTGSLNANNLEAGGPREVPVLTTAFDGSRPQHIAGLSLAQYAVVLNQDGRRMTLTSEPMRTAFSDDSLLRVTGRSSGVLLVNRKVAAGASVDSFRITSFDGRGNRVWSRAYAYRPIPVATRQADSMRTRLVDTYMQLGVHSSRAALSELVYREFPVPAYHPPVSEVLTGRDGSIWVGGPAIPGLETRWRVLNATGSAVFEVSFPPGVKLIAVNGSAAWGTVRDEFDVPKLLRYTIR